MWPKRKYLWIAIPVLLLAAGVVGVSEMNRAKSVVVPAGTEIQVRLDRSIASNRSTSGDPFQATVAAPIVINEKTVIPKGAPVKGRIVSARESGQLEGVARLRLFGAVEKSLS